MVDISTNSRAQPVYLVNGDPTSGSAGVPTSSGSTTTLASGSTIAATAGGTPITNVSGGRYIWDAQFTGTSITLQSLGSDNITWRDVASLTASGTFGNEISIGAGSSMRLYNPNGTSDTNVYSTLSKV